MSTPANAVPEIIKGDAAGNMYCSLDGGLTFAPFTVAPGNIPAATSSAAGLLPSTGVPLGLLPANLFKAFCVVGNNGAGHVAAVGVKVGDKVVMQANVTDAAEATVFEATVTVADQIQQSGTNLSAKTIVFLVIAQS